MLLTSCTIHARRNIIDRLKEMKISDALSRSILNEIFRKRSGDTYIQGLIDAEDPADFDARLLILEKSWSEQEMREIGSNTFAPWFRRYKAEMYKEKMICSARIAAGMSCSEHFSTNASEAVNMIIKSKMNYKKSDLPILVTKLKELINDQLQELENSIISKGKFSIKPSYNHLVVSESAWYKMSELERKGHIKKFHETDPVPTSSVSSLNKSSDSVISSLSISQNAAVELTSLSRDIIDGIWAKAAKLLDTDGALAPAPGLSPLARNVISTSKAGFHTVIVRSSKNAQFICDCPHFLSIKLCSHAVAAAEANNLLPNFLQSFKPVSPNITKLVTSDICQKGEEKRQ